MEQTTKNLLNAPKCKFLAPRLDPVPFLLDESFDESECDSTSTNNDSPKWDKILKIKKTICHKSDKEIEFVYEN